MTSPSQYAPRCWAMSWGDSQVALRQSAVKLCFPAQHPERLSMRAGRPYFQSRRGNAASGRRAKTPGSKAAHRHALRATNPFKTRVSPVFSRKLQKNGNAALKGLVAQRYRLLAGDLAATVCGASPPNKPTRGRVFLLAGAAKFIRLPPACSVPPG